MANALDRLANTQDTNATTRMKLCWEAIEHLDHEKSFKYMALEILKEVMKATIFLGVPIKCHKR